MDVLSDVLSVTRMGSTVVAQAELVPPWGLEIDPIAEAHIHVVQRGVCWLRVAGERRHIRLTTGDVVMIRGGVGHSVCDDPKTKPAPHKEVLEAMPRRLQSLPESRAHETTVVLCAKYLFQHVGPHPLTSIFPSLVHLPAHEAERHVQLQLLLQLLRHEAVDADSGSELVVPRLVDSLLVYVVRAWLEGQPVGAGGWFGALRDPAIATALSLIHQQPQKPWSVASLARQVAHSRPTFARRFAELVGETPVAYLTRWRMCLATKLLTETELSLDEVAARVGYETAAAFSKAFRRRYGDAPGRFRSEMQSSRTAIQRDSGLRAETNGQVLVRHGPLRFRRDHYITDADERKPVFIVFLRFSANKHRANELMADHNHWIASGLADGVFLLVGSLQPRLGGAVVASNTTRTELEERLQADPFVAHGVVTVELFEVSPAKSDPRLAFLLA